MHINLLLADTDDKPHRLNAPQAKTLAPMVHVRPANHLCAVMVHVQPAEQQAQAWDKDKPDKSQKEAGKSQQVQEAWGKDKLDKRQKGVGKSQQVQKAPTPTQLSQQVQKAAWEKVEEGNNSQQAQKAWDKDKPKEAGKSQQAQKAAWDNSKQVPGCNKEAWVAWAATEPRMIEQTVTRLMSTLPKHSWQASSRTLTSPCQQMRCRSSTLL